LGRECGAGQHGKINPTSALNRKTHEKGRGHGAGVSERESYSLGKGSLVGSLKWKHKVRHMSNPG